MIVSAGNDAAVRIWDAAGAPVRDPLTGHTDRVTAVSVGRLGKLELPTLRSSTTSLVFNSAPPCASDGLATRE